MALATECSKREERSRLEQERALLTHESVTSESFYKFSKVSIFKGSKSATMRAKTTMAAIARGR